MEPESVEDRSKRRRTDGSVDSDVDDEDSLGEEICKMNLHRRQVERLGYLFADEAGDVDNRMKPTVIQYAKVSLPV